MHLDFFGTSCVTLTLSVPLEVSGRHQDASGGIWRHLGGIWNHLEASGRHLETSFLFLVKTPQPKQCVLRTGSLVDPLVFKITLPLHFAHACFAMFSAVARTQVRENIGTQALDTLPPECNTITPRRK